MYTYICSLHLVGGNGPTMKNRDPIKMGIIVSILSFHSIFVLSHTGVYHGILGHTTTITTPSTTNNNNIKKNKN